MPVLLPNKPRVGPWGYFLLPDLVNMDRDGPFLLPDLVNMDRHGPFNCLIWSTWIDMDRLTA